MKTIRATVLDTTHLELSQPISAAPGTLIEIAIPEPKDDPDERVWREKARERLLDAYDARDAIYDDL